MISCTEFIMTYSELFKFLEKRRGKPAVLEFWNALSDEFLQNLRKLARTRGMQGLRVYWTHTLEEEAADYDMYATPEEFTIEMHCCPSVGILRRAKHLKPYEHYCDHCDVLYARVIEDYGMRCSLEKVDEKKGICRFRVVKVRRKGAVRSRGTGSAKR